MSQFSLDHLKLTVVADVIKLVPTRFQPPVIFFVDFVIGAYRPSIWYLADGGVITKAFPKHESLETIMALCDQYSKQQPSQGWAELTISIQSPANFDVIYKPSACTESELNLLPEGRSEQVARAYFGDGPIQFEGDVGGISRNPKN